MTLFKLFLSSFFALTFPGSASASTYYIRTSRNLNWNSTATCSIIGPVGNPAASFVPKCGGDVNFIAKTANTSGAVNLANGSCNSITINQTHNRVVLAIDANTLTVLT